MVCPLLDYPCLPDKDRIPTISQHICDYHLLDPYAAMLHIKECWNEYDRKKQRMQSIFDLPQYKPQFPSSSMAFLSGGSGNLVYQSFQNGWTLWKHRIAQGKQRPTVKLSCTNIIYAGLITTSYMFVIDKLGCGDFSFPTRLSRRYAGGYCSGVIAISFLFLCDLNGKLVNPMNAIKRASHLFCSRLLTVCPLVMVQQAGYDHLRILCDPFFPSSIPLFFVTGLATGVWAQFLVQPFITLLTPSNSLITKRCSISSLYKSFPKNAFHTALMMACCLTVRDVLLGRYDRSDYRKRCDRRKRFNEMNKQE